MTLHGFTQTIDLVIEKMGEESLRAGKEIMGITVDPAKMTAPLYVLGFDGSKIGIEAPMDVNKILAEEFNARDYVIIEPGGHNYMLEKNWQAFAEKFKSWIDAM